MISIQNTLDIRFGQGFITPVSAELSFSGNSAEPNIACQNATRLASLFALLRL
jgi:hypothetical protein